MNDRQDVARLVGDHDAGRYVFNSAGYPLGEHLACRKKRFASRGLQIGQVGAFRIGSKFIDVEEISWHNVSEELRSLLNILLCNRFLCPVAIPVEGNSQAGALLVSD
jgi:hypothetical protein